MIKITQQILNKIIIIPAILLAFTVQGYAKAKMADRLGDKTPRFQGRLSFNPLDHIDLVGFIMILIMGFGWTKPVQTNPNAYKRGYKDAYKVALAPLLAMLLVSFIGSFIYMAFIKFGYTFSNTSFFGIFESVILQIIIINISLFIFNLIPLPGLAGFDLLSALSPKFVYKYSGNLYRYQFVFFIGIIVFGEYILTKPVIYIVDLFLKIAALVFL